MILAALEDKTYRGAFVASPTMPWSWGTNDDLENPSGAYHLVWARDLYEKASGLMADGDRAAAERALDYLFGTQQKADGSFPQNSTVDGTPHWTNTQLDEVADPIVLAWQLGRRDAGTWKPRQGARPTTSSSKGPQTPQERWENQNGYSPATIGAEIAGLVCAADIAKANGDAATRKNYLDTADAWQSKVKSWTVTTNGPYSPKPYFLRLTKDGKPDSGTKYDVGDSGPNGVDQRAIVDPSFLELVRLGVLPAERRGGHQLASRSWTPSSARRRPAGCSGTGTTSTGTASRPTAAAGTSASRPAAAPPGVACGRCSPVSAESTRSPPGSAADERLANMAATANSGGLLAEQVWDNSPPAGKPGFTPGTPTLSATPLGWAHGQYVRLAWSLREHRSISTPSVVACRYVPSACKG